MQPTYRLLDGSVGNSYAIEISKHLGLNQGIIQHAFIVKDESMTTSQKLLEKLQSELSAVLQEKEALEKLQKETADKEKHYQQLIDNYQSKKNDLRSKFSNAEFPGHSSTFLLRCYSYRHTRRH